LPSKPNYEIIFVYKFIIIIFIVLYCKNSLRDSKEEK